MRYISCNLCGQDNADLVNQGPDLLLNLWDQTYCLVRCRNCGLIYQNPQLTLEELLDLHYPASYICFNQDIDDKKSVVNSIDRYFGIEKRCRRIQRHFTGPGKLLDIGCATGIFMNAMRARGWQVAGVEINEYAADYARKTLNLDVFTGTLEEAQYPDQSIDLACLWGVFEHVIDPRATLQEIRRVLKPGGLVAIAVPNPASLEALLFRASWVGWDRPRHLHLFTTDVIQRYLDLCGFHLVSTESFFGHLKLTLLNIEFWCKLNKIPVNKWAYMLKALYNWPLRFVTMPVYWVGDAFNKTTNIVYFARKER